MSGFSVVDLILAKREGGALTDGQIRWLIDAYTGSGSTGGQVPDEQMSALLMAIVWRGLDPAELSSWTAAMVASGDAARPVRRRAPHRRQALHRRCR